MFRKLALFGSIAALVALLAACWFAPEIHDTIVAHRYHKEALRAVRVAASSSHYSIGAVDELSNIAHYAMFSNKQLAAATREVFEEANLSAEQMRAILQMLESDKKEVYRFGDYIEQHVAITAVLEQMVRERTTTPPDPALPFLPDSSWSRTVMS